MRLLFFGARRPYFNYFSGRIGRNSGIAANWYEELFREELARNCDDVFFWGKGYWPTWDEKVALPTLLSWYGDFDAVVASYKCTPILGFNDVKDTLKVYNLGDFYAGAKRERRNWKYLTNFRYDIYVCYSQCIVDNLISKKIPGKYYVIPFHVDINKHRKLEFDKKYDVMFSMNLNSPEREELSTFVKSLQVPKFCGGVYFMDNVIKINESKIVLNSNFKELFTNPRTTEVLACGSFLLTTFAKDMDTLGFKDGEHFVVYKDINDLREKIDYYLKHEDEREKIAETGMNFVRENYNMTKRVQRFLDVIRENL